MMHPQIYPGRARAPGQSFAQPAPSARRGQTRKEENPTPKWYSSQQIVWLRQSTLLTGGPAGHFRCPPLGRSANESDGRSWAPRRTAIGVCSTRLSGTRRSVQMCHRRRHRRRNRKCKLFCGQLHRNHPSSCHREGSCSLNRTLLRMQLEARMS